MLEMPQVADGCRSLVEKLTECFAHCPHHSRAGERTAFLRYYLFTCAYVYECEHKVVYQSLQSTTPTADYFRVVRVHMCSCFFARRRSIDALAESCMSAPSHTSRRPSSCARTFFAGHSYSMTRAGCSYTSTSPPQPANMCRHATARHVTQCHTVGLTTHHSAQKYRLSQSACSLPWHTISRWRVLSQPPGLC